MTFDLSELRHQPARIGSNLRQRWRQPATVLVMPTVCIQLFDQSMQSSPVNKDTPAASIDYV